MADDAHRVYSNLTIKSSPDVIGVFSDGRKLRILYECELTNDRARAIINDDIDSMDKEMLYKVALFDPITDHYNWYHLVPFLEMPADNGIDDYAFVHFDIKEFRVINEVYGHIAANEVLKNVVKAMKEVFGFRTEMMGKALSLSASGIYVIAIAAVCIASFVVIYQKTYKRR